MATFGLTVIPSGWEWEVLSNDEVFTDSAGGMWTRGRVGNRWQFTLTFLNLVGSTRRDLWSQVSRLRGRRDRLAITMDLLDYNRAGVGGGTPVLAATADPGATQLSVSGAPLSTTGWLENGDFVTVDGELKIVVADVSTDAGGLATVEIWPEIHKGATAGKAVEIDPASVSGVFFLQSAQGFGAVPHPGDWLNQAPALVLEEDVYA